MDGWLGVVIMVGLGLGFAATMIGLSSLLGPKNPTPEKLAPYECGMPAVGDARYFDNWVMRRSSSAMACVNCCLRA